MKLHTGPTLAKYITGGLAVQLGRTWLDLSDSHDTAASLGYLFCPEAQLTGENQANLSTWLDLPGLARLFCKSCQEKTL